MAVIDTGPRKVREPEIEPSFPNGQEQVGFWTKTKVVVAAGTLAVLSYFAVDAINGSDSDPTVVTPVTSTTSNPEITTTTVITSTTSEKVNGSIDTVEKWGYEWNENWNKEVINGETIPLATPGYPAPLTASTPEGLNVQFLAAWNAALNDWDPDGNFNYEESNTISPAEYFYALGVDRSDPLTSTSQSITDARYTQNAYIDDFRVSTNSIDYSGEVSPNGVLRISSSELSMLLTGYTTKTLESVGELMTVYGFDQDGQPSLIEFGTTLSELSENDILNL